jgi:hypothetical protein
MSRRWRTIVVSASTLVALADANIALRGGWPAWPWVLDGLATAAWTAAMASAFRASRGDGQRPSR